MGGTRERFVPSFMQFSPGAGMFAILYSSPFLEARGFFFLVGLYPIQNVFL